MDLQADSVVGLLQLTFDQALGDEPVPDDFTITFDYEGDRSRRYRDEFALTTKTVQGGSGAQPSK